MKALITGGAGFVGSHTVRKFLTAGADVTVLDSFQVYSYPMELWFFENMEYRYNELLKGADIIRGSTLDKDDLRRIILDVKPTHIVHFAALPIANLAVRKSEEAFKNILQGTVNILEVLKDYDVERFVYISSSMAYGDFETVPVLETARMNPKGLYGGMKLAGEILTKVYTRSYGIPTTIIRPSAVYGPADNNTRVVQKFLTNAFLGEPITVQNPESVLDFTFVIDVARGIFMATSLRAGMSQIFNITCGEGRTLSELVRELRSRFPKLQVVEEKKYSPLRPKRGTLSISKANTMLEYRPVYSLSAGIDAYVEYMRSYNKFAWRRHA